MWWLSFADDDECRGVVLVEADSFVGAVARTHALGINPGGEVWGAEVPEGEKEHDPAHRNRLLSTDELRVLFGAKRLREWEDEGVEAMDSLPS